MPLSPKINSPEMKLFTLPKCPNYLKINFIRNKLISFFKPLLRCILFQCGFCLLRHSYIHSPFCTQKTVLTQLFLTCVVSSLNNTQVDFRPSCPAKNDFDRPKICDKLKISLIIAYMTKRSESQFFLVSRQKVLGTIQPNGHSNYHCHVLRFCQSLNMRSIGKRCLF